MRIRITPIPASVADGTNKTMRDAVEALRNILEDGRELEIPLSDFADGLSFYIERLKYMGSRGVVENLTALLACGDTQVLMDTLRQWKEAEEMMWEVVDDQPTEESD